MKNEVENIAGVLAGATGNDEATIHQALRQGLILSPEQAVDYGLVHEIREELFPTGARVLRVEPPITKPPT